MPAEVAIELKPTNSYSPSSAGQSEAIAEAEMMVLSNWLYKSCVV